MSTFHSLLELVGALARKRYQMAEQTFAKLGLNHTEARLLRILEELGGEASQDGLSQLVFIDRSNVGRALKRLEQDGYIERGRSNADKRARSVAVTSKGRSTVAQIRSLGNEIATSFFGDMTEEEARQALTALRKAL